MKYISYMYTCISYMYVCLCLCFLYLFIYLFKFVKSLLENNIDFVLLNNITRIKIKSIILLLTFINKTSSYFLNLNKSTNIFWSILIIHFINRWKRFLLFVLWHKVRRMKFIIISLGKNVQKHLLSEFVNIQTNVNESNYLINMLIFWIYKNCFLIGVNFRYQ